MAGTIVTDNIQAASTSQMVIKNGVANTPPTIQDSGGTEIGTFCRAWVNFNGTGTVAIRASFNVTSITDDGVGLYTVNMTTAMPDANYIQTGFANYTTASSAGLVSNSSSYSPTTSSCSVRTVQSNAATAIDASFVNVAFFR